MANNSQLVGGELVGFLQAWQRIWSWNYREQIELAVMQDLNSGLRMTSRDKSSTLTTRPRKRNKEKQEKEKKS